jgi:squalene cyclase
MSPGSRIALIQKHGGDPKIEDAVTRSLDWLKSKQNEDGSWGTSSSKAGYTGLVLQCLTGHGEGLTSAAYGSVVTKACDFLIQTAAANAQGMLSSNTKGGGGTYEHGIATAALGEAYILAKASGSVPPELAGTFQKAAQFIIESQNQRGSWSYGGIEAGQLQSHEQGRGSIPGKLATPGARRCQRVRHPLQGTRCLPEKSG